MNIVEDNAWEQIKAGGETPGCLQVSHFRFLYKCRVLYLTLQFSTARASCT